VLPEEVEYIEEIDSADVLLQAQDNRTGIQDNKTGQDGGNSQTREGHGSDDHDCTSNDTNHNSRDAYKRRSLPASPGVR